VLSKVAILGVFAIFQSLVLLFMVQAFEPLRQSVFMPPLLEVFITFVLVAFCGLLSGLVISAAAGSEDRANTLLPFVLIPQIVFAGAMFPLKDQILQVIGLVFPMRWAMIALGTSIGLHSDKLNGDALLGDNTAFRGTLYSIFTQQEAMQRLFLSWGAFGLTIALLIVAICLFMKRMDVGRPEQPRNRRLRLNFTRKPSLAPTKDALPEAKAAL
jgi:ABC transport system ATP-binding/permease protein